MFMFLTTNFQIHEAKTVITERINKPIQNYSQICQHHSLNNWQKIYNENWIDLRSGVNGVRTCTSSPFCVAGAGDKSRGREWRNVIGRVNRAQTLLRVDVVIKQKLGFTNSFLTAIIRLKMALLTNSPQKKFSESGTR